MKKLLQLFVICSLGICINASSLVLTTEAQSSPSKSEIKSWIFIKILNHITWSGAKRNKDKMRIGFIGSDKEIEEDIRKNLLIND